MKLLSLQVAAFLVLGFLGSHSEKPADCPPVSPEEKTAEEKAFASWQKTYHLEPGQIVKRVAPPFIPERLAGAERRMPFLKQNRERRGNVATLFYRMKDDAIDDMSITFSGNPLDEGRQLVHLLEVIAKIPAQDIEGPAKLLETPVPGDFIVRADATKEEAVSALQSILWLECGLKINLKLREVERDVVFVRGKFQFKPRVEGRDTIDLYGATLTPEQGGGGSGPFDDLLAWTGNFVEPKTRLIDEVEDSPKDKVSWHLNARSPYTEEERLADHDVKAVLKHLGEQTGLTFTPGKKKVVTLFVETGK